MNKKTSYGIRAVAIAALFLLVYMAAYFLLADLEKNVSWIGFGFAVLAFLLTGGGLWIGIAASDSLQTAENIYEALHLLWLYPALAVVLNLISAFLPAGAWKLLVLLEVVLLAGAAIYAIVGATAAARMTELDREGEKAGSRTERRARYPAVIEKKGRR